jgi:hypothetical protein
MPRATGLLASHLNLNTASFGYDWSGEATRVEIASAAIEGTEYSTFPNPSLSRRGEEKAES